MWQSYLEAFFLALASSGMAFGIAKLVVVIGERMIEQRHGTAGIRDLLARRARLEQALEARHGKRRETIKKTDEEIRAVVRRKQRLDSQLADLQRNGEQMVRLFGEEVKGLPCFQAQVLNRYVGSAAGQPQHAFIDAVWAQPQLMEIWAPSLQEARKEIENRYPPAFGYKITSLQEVGASAPAGIKAAQTEKAA